MAVEPRNTSRRCPACGHTAKENRPTQEKFHCQTCVATRRTLTR
ncbi:zinc ribbon domain-containing protein [Streptomyces sp. KL116D]